MTLSVIIVNYNVKYFLEQCLHSVARATEGIEAEVLVVDNHSTDESLPYLASKFSWVRFIKNETNSGFSKACNKGLSMASGDYILFLNPDTIVAEDSFVKCIRFFETHADCGAVGVKMIDGSGRFLKESKRAFPSPLTSLFKLFGLSRLFPKSKIFSRYHLGHLDKDQNHEVDVLAGAFMMVKKEVLQQVGPFDDEFFMYGEDVDLSYRIQKATCPATGNRYKNYYLADTTIIHFKGESTRRSSFNYVRMFYYAMSIFVKKHYGGVRAGFFIFCIHVAIWIRAVIAAVLKAIRWVGLPVLDAALILFSFWALKEVWINYVRTDIVYPNKLLLVSLPVFTVVYLSAGYYAGLYERYFKISNLFRSTLIATVTVLVVYALLPEHLRFSRGIVLFGAMLAFILIMVQRLLLVKAKILLEPLDASSKPHVLIAASEAEYISVRNFLHKKDFDKRLIGRISVNGQKENAVSHLDVLENTAVVLNAKELIFCAGSLSYKTIVSYMNTKKPVVKYRFHAMGSSSIVGSDTSTESGETFSAETEFAIERSYNRRLKRLIDVATAFLFLLTFPLHLFLVAKPFRFLLNCFLVLTGQKTWIGYSAKNTSLPVVRSGVLGPNGKLNGAGSAENNKLLYYWYARNYEPLQDVKTIFAHYQNLGN